LSYYGIPETDSLTGQYIALEANVLRKECEKVFSEYNDLMLQAESARLSNDFILAHRIVSQAVSYSMDHLNCRIKDDDAWYQKVILEMPAEFQKMENDLNELAHGSCSDYLNSFQYLINYYYRNKLLEQGVVFMPLFDRLMQMQDPVFLEGMLHHYIMLKDFDHAFRLLERLHKLGLPSGPLADEQKSLAEFMARRDAVNSNVSEPWEILASYTVRDKWYRPFNWKYKFTWLKETGWKLKYWPFIWKK
jgi:hypothetical protein